MASASKACFDCGMPLVFGVAKCSYCGAKIGTVFDETVPMALPTRANQSRHKVQQMDSQTKIEKAQEKANSSVVWGFSSFVPLLGLLPGVASIIFGVMAMRTLKEMNVEDGRGSATAGIVISALGMIAQACWGVYILKLVNIVSV
jgi:hypothetical protein